MIKSNSKLCLKLGMYLINEGLYWLKLQQWFKSLITACPKPCHVFHGAAGKALLLRTLQRCRATATSIEPTGAWRQFCSPCATWFGLAPGAEQPPACPHISQKANSKVVNKGKLGWAFCIKNKLAYMHMTVWKPLERYNIIPWALLFLSFQRCSL